ncbi:12D3 antigen [Babesia caballi]|uniref:12D3 antigen n=1 Tax=Babesia caballi TaxID=5871 RepID=A0AAV4LTF2_BABCB|nr:12D3 antigen [Babesia caballi]
MLYPGSFCVLLFLLTHGYVSGFIYRAIPMYEANDKLTSHNVAIGDAMVVVDRNAVGKTCRTMLSGGYIVNPYIQRCPIGKSMCGPDMDKSLGMCADFSGCYTISMKTRACTCMAGYFGNPYVKCFKHCDTDHDCPSPYAECRKDGNEKIKRCKCKEGCPGDGVICKPNNICTDDKENAETHRKCLQTSTKDKSYVCDDGYYLDTYYKCVQIVNLKEVELVSVVANNFVDGSRIDVGKCFSMEINKENGESHFYQMNSGDAIVVKGKIVTTPQLYLVFEIKKNDIIAFAMLDTDHTKLTKLFTISNGLNGCHVDGVTKYSPTGVRMTPSHVKVEVKKIGESDGAIDEL